LFWILSYDGPRLQLTTSTLSVVSGSGHLARRHYFRHRWKVR